MRIPLLYIPKTGYKKFLHVERCYASPRLIIPIGCDCHPAYSLQKLHIRKNSYPFDWLNTAPLLGLQYIADNLDSGFKNFMNGLTLNKDGNVVSCYYEYAEFIHEKDLPENDHSKKKLERRIARFLNDIAIHPASYLYNLPVSALTNDEDITSFITSVDNFFTTIKDTDSLHIYLRYDESYAENQELADKLFELLKGYKKLFAFKYIRGLKKYGIWGNPATYTTLYKKLSIPTKEVFPKIYIK